MAGTSVTGEMGHVYVLRNLATGDCYIGFTTMRPAQRVRQHFVNAHCYLDSPLMLAEDIRAYGDERFRLDVVFSGDPGVARLLEWRLIRAIQPTYNGEKDYRERRLAETRRAALVEYLERHGTE